MIGFILNDSSKASRSHNGIAGFFFRAIIVAVSLYAFSAVPSMSVAQEMVIEFADSEKLDFRIQVRNSDGSEISESTSVKVWVDGSNIETAPPILGKVSSAQRTILFTPRFSFKRGKAYRVVVSQAGNDDPTSVVLKVPAKENKPTRIESIFPSADEVPENLLRFYVQFSAPSSREKKWGRSC